MRYSKCRKVYTIATTTLACYLMHMYACCICALPVGCTLSVFMLRAHYTSAEPIFWLKFCNY